MLLLALDTSTELGSVALVANAELRSEISARVRSRHGETLLPLVQQALSLGGADKAELTHLAVGLGPGSFTGTRVGVATAKGLAVALDLPLIGVVSLEAIALGAPSTRVNVVTDAHKGEVYAACYRREAGRVLEEVEPFHAAPEAAHHRLPSVPSVGSGTRRYPHAFVDTLPAVFDHVRGSMVARVARSRIEAGETHDRAALEPLYVRASDATLPKTPLKVS
ncbi:MAG: tRNA (adenosine(37)-N6)-threonylcarbamoyltransferase complex dimerization subunit type 1 TsaB [Sandaracinaceae bacterium]